MYVHIAEDHAFNPFCPSFQLMWLFPGTHHHPACAHCRGKPLVAVEPGKTGRKWRHPSPSTAVKAAMLRTMCQALVPDNVRQKASQVQAGREERRKGGGLCGWKTER